MDFAESANYSIAILFFDILFHIAPRVLKWNGWFSEPCIVSKGILAGTRKSNTFARIFLYPIIQKLHYEIPASISTTIKIFVDDIAQNVYGALNNIVDDAELVVKALYSKLIDSQLVISKKSTAIASSARILEELRVKLQKSGIQISTAKSVKDLGVDATAGKRRSTKTIRARTSKAKSKGVKLTALRKMASSKGHKSTRFWHSNLWPTQAYGMPAFGLAPITLKASRIMAARTLQDRTGQCTYSSIAVGLGEDKDPEILNIKEAITFWTYSLSTAQKKSSTFSTHQMDLGKDFGQTPQK